MKLIMRSEFDNLRINDNHFYETDNCSGKQVVKIFNNDGILISKMIKRKTANKTKTSYYGIKGFEKYLTEIKI